MCNRISWIPISLPRIWTMSDVPVCAAALIGVQIDYKVDMVDIAYPRLLYCVQYLLLSLPG